MAKFKPAGARRPATRSNRGLIPCAILIIGALGLMILLFYELLKSGAK